jgi:hypothetical protein
MWVLLAVNRWRLHGYDRTTGVVAKVPFFDREKSIPDAA